MFVKPETRLLCLAACLLVCVPALAQEAAPSHTPAWDQDVLRMFRTLPILDEGRVKPLDTYASFKLLKFNGRRSCTTPDGTKRTPVEWLLDCLLYPEVAQNYAVFSVDNSAVIVALGILPHEKKRDRYSYRELKPGAEKLFDLAQTYAHMPARDRTTTQAQIVNLAQNITEYEHLADYTQFARKSFTLEPCDLWTRLFPNRTEVTLLDVLKNAKEIHEAFATGSQEQDEAGKKNIQAVSKLLRDLDAVRSTATGLALFPPAQSDDQAWRTPDDIVLAAFQDGADAAGDVELLGAFDEMVRARDNPAQFEQQAARFCSGVVERATQRGEYGKIGLEVSFYHWQFFYRSLVFYVLAFLIVALLWLMPRNRVLGKAAALAVVIPTVLLIAGIAYRCVIRGRPPVTTLYETILFTTAVAVVVSLAVEYLNRQRIAISLAAIIGVLGLFLANKYEASEGVDTMPSMVAVLDTNFWLATHVTTISMGYAAGLLSGAIAHVYVFARLFGLKKQDPGFYEGLTRMVYGVFCFGFLFTFIGTLLGGIWADQSWGRFWGWDPKENGALLICLWQLAVLHARGGRYIRDLGLSLSAVVCGMVVAFSWWGVNLLGVGLHSYGFTSGAMTSLTVFWMVELVVVGLGAVVWARQKKTTLWGHHGTALR